MSEQLPAPNLTESLSQPPSGRVLVVDDDRSIRELLRAGLLMEGFDVVLAAGGAEGLERIGTDASIRVTLLDLDMPKIDGRLFRQVQRADPRLASIPTVMVSGTAMTPDLRAELQAAAYVSKPFNRVYLIGIVKKYCGPIEAAPPLSEPAGKGPAVRVPESLIP